MKLNGLLQGNAPVSIAGGFNPLSKNVFADVKMVAKDLPALAFNGYASRHLGYELTGGRVSLDIDAKLRDGMIESETVTVLENISLGDKVTSPDATKVPVKIALLLLRDIEGEIVMDVLVSGRIEDSNFRYGRVSSRALSHLWAQVDDLPFEFMGMGGRGESRDIQLKNYAFMAGAAELSDEAIENLDQLAELLLDRPMLRFKLSGGYDRQEDGVELLPAALDREPGRLAKVESFDARGNWHSSSRARALVEFYQETFNELPIDPDGELPPPAVPPVDQSIPESQTQAEQENRSLLV